MSEDQPGVLGALSSELETAVATAAAATARVDARHRLPASGIVWDRQMIVTAAHVLERDEDIVVALPDGEEVAASLAGRDNGSDIAVLRVPEATLEVPVWSDEAAVGIIRAIGGSWRAPGGVPVGAYLRADVTMYPGFSGGPLVDTAGRILGINTSRDAANDGFTVPTEKSTASEIV